MQFSQVPELVTSQSDLQAPVYQYVQGVSSQRHLEGVGVVCYSDGSKAAICFNQDHTTLRRKHLEPLQDSSTLLSPGDVCTDQDAMVPTISSGMSSNNENKNVPHGKKRSVNDILGSFANDLLSADYEDPEVSLLISSMDYFYKDTTYGDIPSKKNTSRSAPPSSFKPLSNWYYIFKKRQLSKLKAKAAKYQKSDKAKKQKGTHVNK